MKDTNKAISTLNYTGVVTISQYIKDRKIKITQLHNTGAASLFSFLANCLAGNFASAKDNWPTKIKVLERITEGAKEQHYTYNSLSGFIFLRTAPELDLSNLTEGRVRYSFMIPRDLVENITNKTDIGFGLYTNGALEDEPENFAAFCAIDGTLTGELNNSSLLVDWELIISNPNSTSSH
jgi:hypothetical protein